MWKKIEICILELIPGWFCGSIRIRNPPAVSQRFGAVQRAVSAAEIPDKREDKRIGSKEKGAKKVYRAAVFFVRKNVR